jgi:hypothetical protein
VAVARDPAGDKEKMASRRRKPEGGAWPVVKHRAGGAWAAAVSRMKRAPVRRRRAGRSAEFGCLGGGGEEDEGIGVEAAGRHRAGRRGKTSGGGFYTPVGLG